MHKTRQASASNSTQPIFFYRPISGMKLLIKAVIVT